MDGLRWEVEGMKPEGTRIEEIGLAMPFHAIPCHTATCHYPKVVLTGYCEAGG